MPKPSNENADRRSQGRTAEVRRYPWEQLSSVDPDHLEQRNRLAQLLGRRNGRRGALRALGAELEELTGLDHELHIHGMRRWRDLAEPPGFGDALRTEFHLPPDPDAGVVAVEMELVDRWLSSLLDRPPETRPLDEVDGREFGLVTFVLLSVLDRLKEWGAPPVVLPTDPPVESVLEERLLDAESLVEVTIGARVEGRDHLARLLVSEGLLRNMELFADGEPSRQARLERLRSGRWAGLSVRPPVVAGATTLRREIAADLGEGDVVLFDEHGWAEDGSDSAEHPAGARLYLARFSRDCSLPGRLRAGASHWEFEIADTVLQHHETAMSDADSEPPEASAEADDPSEASTELLESPEVRLEVRVGSAHLRLRDLSNLSPGQVLELDREVGDRADLVVDGETIGAGELVEVEGKLGVRIDRIDS